MESFGWSHFDMKNEPGNVAFMAANTMSEIAAMYTDTGKLLQQRKFSTKNLIFFIQSEIIFCICAFKMWLLLQKRKTKTNRI